MDKKKKILVVGAAAIAALLVIMAVLLMGGPTPVTEGVPILELGTNGGNAIDLNQSGGAGPAPAESNLSDLEAMQLEPPADYISQLKAIIEGDPDPYVRENAVLVLAELALRKNETANITDYLKSIATGEENEDVRTSAFVSLGLIRDKYPLEKKGSLELSLTGAIRKGANVTLNARVSTAATPPGPVIVSIPSLPSGVELLSKTGVVKFPLNAGETKEVRFTLRLKETGEYYIPATFMMSFDSVDYEKIRKEAHIRVTEAGGEILG